MSKLQECNPHEWSFKDPNGYNFEWYFSKEFTVTEVCESCKIEREATYKLIKINGEYTDD